MFYLITNKFHSHAPSTEQLYVLNSNRESAAYPVNRFEFQMQQSELENKQKYRKSTTANY